jgi:hypothetical protein
MAPTVPEPIEETAYPVFAVEADILVMRYCKEVDEVLNQKLIENESVLSNESSETLPTVTYSFTPSKVVDLRL